MKNNLKKKGEDIFIHNLSLVKYPEEIILGNHFALDQFSTIGTSGEFGDYVHIAPNCSIIGGKKSKITMGHFSGLSAGSRIIAGGDDFNNGLIGPTIPIKFRNVNFSHVIIEPFAIIGTNSIVMPNVKIAFGSVVGANSLVTKDTKEWGIYLGTPAKRIKTRKSDEILAAAKSLGYEF
tara:strand:- start:4855 stop:5388 length:534 start_codon:yes stop_codon:yes gene_type:complete